MSENVIRIAGLPVFIPGEFWKNVACLSTQFPCKRESPIQVPQKQSAFHPRAQQNGLRRRDVRQRSRLVIHFDQGVKNLRGPLRSPNWRVLSTWIPALCSPLKRVTVLGQPAAKAS
jgi:hypothetical protein